MPVSIADVQQAHGYIHGYPVEVGADPLVAALCDGDIRADFARRGTMGKHLLEYTLGDMEREAGKAETALAYMQAWGIAAGI